MEFTPEMLDRLTSSAEGLPVYLDRRPPELEDPSQKLAAHHWRPACGTTSKLTRCLEAVRDVAAALMPLAASAHPEAERRLAKQVVTPTYNLAIAVRDLFNHVQSNCGTRLTKDRQRQLAKRFQQFGNAVPTKTGPLKTARDKIAAHVDKDACTSKYRQFWDSFGIGDVLRWVRGCTRMLKALVPPDVYSWTRFSGYSNVWNLMNVDGREVSILITDGQPEAIVGFQFVVSPKAGIMREIRELESACAALEGPLGLSAGAVGESPGPGGG
jgi:hypothetical protein